MERESALEKCYLHPLSLFSISFPQMDAEDKQWTDPVPQQTMAAQCFYYDRQIVTAKRQPGFCQSTVSAIVTEFSLY